MTSPRVGSTDNDWLLLEQASLRLGVHPSTLRRWSNRGAIPTFVTPGGHRRFRRADVEQFESERRQTKGATVTALWTDQAVVQARQEMAKQQWFTVFSEAEREAQRRLGRRLLGLILQFAAGAEEDALLLSEARAIGGEYAQSGFAHRQSLVEVLRATGLFKNILLEAALARSVHPKGANPITNGRLLIRIGRLLGEVQLGVVESYERRTSA